MSAAGKRRVAVLGGGQAALTAALQLTDPHNPAAADTEVTLYQVGWRLGGKGATGLAFPAGQPPYEPGTGPVRIMEHGLHQWFGFYENTFRQIRGVYKELARAPGTPLATFDDAFVGASTMYGVELIEGESLLWPLVAPVAPGAPGEGAPLPTMHEHLALALELVAELHRNSPLAGVSHENHHVLGRAHALLDAARHGRRHEQLSAETAGHLLESAAAIARAAGRGVVHDAVHDVHALIRDLERELPRHGELPTWMRDCEDVALRAVLMLLHLFMVLMWDLVADGISTVARSEQRRFWILANLAYACIAGAIRGGVLERGFDTLNHLDTRAWLRASAYPDGGVMLQSPVVETIYVAAFAYPRGDTVGGLDSAPTENLEAGTALRGIARTMLTYKGHLCYRFAAGTGDTAYAPVYQVLRKRGVDVRFFSRIDRLELEDGRIARVHVAEQAGVVGDVAYEPLVDVAGLPCWPLQPRWEQLVDGDWFRQQDADFEWPSSEMRARERPRVLEVGADYDDVVLGISIAGLREICPELVGAWPAWATALERIKTVRTQSLQLWVDEDAGQLGFPAGVVKQSTGWRYDRESALGAWNDFSELIDREHWPAERRRPRNISYFTSTMPDSPRFGDQQAADDRVRVNALRMLRQGWHVLLPHVLGEDGDFRWDLLVGADAAADALVGPARLDGQWIRANVLPTERYVLSVVDSSQYRLQAHDPAGPGNLYLAGDWTQCTLNCGCMEAATISGMLCANALSGFPSRAAIVGLDL